MNQSALNKSFLLLVLVLFSFGQTVFDVQAAKHRGHGSSIAKRHDSTRQQTPPSAAQRPAQQTMPSPAAAIETRPAAALTAGGLLAAVFTGTAFDGIRLADIAMLALLFGAVYFIFRMLRKKPANNAMQYAVLGAETTPSLPPRMFGGTAQPAPYPLGFEIEPFLRSAKEGYFRLQAANAYKDLDVIRDYTTPETFQELSKQIAARGNERQECDIITLDAELLELAIEHNIAHASVRFSGLSREPAGAPARPFYEIWDVQKFLNDSDSVWLLARIKQVG
ncbi:MAG TPA: Tim44-like domain-containing protein [Burkholderiales bacterium]|nr:Tim44-like domain-containing protein [Burkholderiales bacterium]